MFTGIITDIGRVQNLVKKGDLKIVIATSYDTEFISIGASICCSGVCLTLVDKGEHWFSVEVSKETTDNTNKNKEVDDVIDVHNEGEIKIINSNSESESENTNEKETNDDLNTNNIENLEKYDSSGNIIDKSYSMHQAFGIEEDDKCIPCSKNVECKDAKKQELSDDELSDDEDDPFISIISVDDIPTYILEKHDDAYEILWKISRDLYCELRPEPHTKYYIEHEGDDIFINESHCNFLILIF